MRRGRASTLRLPVGRHPGDALPRRSGAVQTRASALDRLLARGLLAALNAPPLSIVLWDETVIAVSAERPVGRLHVHDRAALVRLVRNSDLHFGDLYSSGRVEVEGDLVASLEAAYRGWNHHRRHSRLVRLQERLINRPRRNGVVDATRNIHHHYDLGNDFYGLWLDQAAMQYTCAYFPDPELSLEQAQLAKLDHVARKLRLRPGERVVEAGCGWGGLARHFARHYGVSVVAYNISREQVEYARARATAEGLSDRVQYVLDDYRRIDGAYDVFVSIGMLEHVGTANFRQLGDTIDRCLKPDGRGLIHSIGRNAPAKMNAWVEKRIFPGAYPPTLAEMRNVFEPNEFSVLDVENLRLHYALTLRHWLQRYEAHAGKIETMFDDAFVRAWRLYLAGSVAAFTTGSLQLFQVLFARGESNELPWSRAHLYR